MKNILFTLVVIGMLLMCLSLITRNIYILGLAEIIVIVPTVKLIILNFKKS
jgi:membrane protein implicated in regulation of membrane protease activity